MQRQGERRETKRNTMIKMNTRRERRRGDAERERERKGSATTGREKGRSREAQR